MESVHVELPGRPTLRCLISEGEGPSYLLVHGLASNAAMWLGVAERLEGRVVAVDLRGHGRSEKPDEGYSIPEVVADLVALIDVLGLERPVVAGQSWGGNVVIQLAADQGPALSGVACVDGGWIRLPDAFPTFEQCWDVLAPPALGAMPYDELAARIASNGWPQTGIDGVLGCFERRPDGTAASWLTRERHQQVLKGLYDHDPFALDVQLPTLLIPTLRNEEPARRLAAGIPGTRVAPMEGHHDLHAEQPEAVADLVRSLAQ